MSVEPGLVPPGPQEGRQNPIDLLDWMGHQFAKFGDTFRASLYGTNVYVTRDPAFAHHVLVENWQNYVKGQFIKRVAVLLGNGLMVSEGELWKRQATETDDSACVPSRIDGSSDQADCDGQFGAS
jgi:hypothetical protein